MEGSEEFSRRWRRLKHSDERRRFLAEELKKMFGTFDSYKNRLAAFGSSGRPVYVEEYPRMHTNNIHVRETERAMFGQNGNEASTSRANEDKSALVNKIVQEMTSIPSLIEDIGPSSSQRVNPLENGTSKRPASSAIENHSPLNKIRKQDANHSPKSGHASASNSTKSATKASTSNSTKSDRPTTNHKSTRLKPNEPPDNATNHRSPTNKPNRSPPIRVVTTLATLARDVQPSTSSPIPSRVDRPSSRLTDTSTRPELSVYKFPDYAVGEYVGYKIGKRPSDADLPDTAVSINIRKMPSIKEIMSRVKEHVKRMAKSEPSNLTCALYLCGIMLYAVYESPASGVKDLLREIIAILSRIKAIFLTEGARESKSYTAVSSLIHLADGHLCALLYESTLDEARKRRQLMEEYGEIFTSFDTNDELATSKFSTLLDIKDRRVSEAILTDLCDEDKIDIPRLYYQLLLESSRHAMLHERHIYARRLAKHQMETSEPALWKRLTSDMGFQLAETDSCIDIADAIFTLVYWLHTERKTN